MMLDFVLHVIIAILTIAVTAAIVRYFCVRHTLAINQKREKMIQIVHEDQECSNQDGPSEQNNETSQNIIHDNSEDDQDGDNDQNSTVLDLPELDESLTTQERIRKYMSDPQLQEVYSKLRAGAESIVQKASVLTEGGSDKLFERFPHVSKMLKTVSKLSKDIVPAGRSLGVFVDVACSVGLMEDSTELMQVLDEIKEVKTEISKGFEELKSKIDQQHFLQLHKKLEAKVQVFEQNLKNKGNLFYRRMDTMVTEYQADEIISDLKLMHNIITGQSTVDPTPLFIKLAKYGNTLEGEEFDEFMVKLLLQFQSIMVLQIRVVRMLRSFLVYSEKDAVFATDMEQIFKDLAYQQSHHNPVAYYDWYLRFKLYGGTFILHTAKWKERYVYMQKNTRC